MKGKLHIAVAQEQADQTSVILYATFPKPAPKADPATGVVSGFDKELPWTAVRNNEGSKVITSVLCGPRALSTSPSADFSIFAGSAAQKDVAGAFYSIDPTTNVDRPWTSEAGNEVNDLVFQIRSAAVAGMQAQPSPAQVALYQTSVGNSVSLRRLDPATGLRGPFSLMGTGDLGQPRAMATCLNPWK
jgi:hypothetical protein